MRRFFPMLAAAVVLILAAFAHSVAGQDKKLRYALFIVVESGRNSQQVNDAEDVAAALDAYGFTSRIVKNPGKSEAEAMIKIFGEYLDQNGGFGVVYISAPVFNYGGGNYFKTRDTNITSPEIALGRAVNLSFVFDAFGGAGGKSLLMLEPVQANPYATLWSPTKYVGGIGAPNPQVPQSMSAFIASRDYAAIRRCGRNGFMASAFLKILNSESLTLGQITARMVAEVFQGSSRYQQPFVAGSGADSFRIVDDSYLLNRPEPRPIEVMWKEYSRTRCSDTDHDEQIRLGEDILRRSDPRISKFQRQVIESENVRLRLESAVNLRRSRYDLSRAAGNWTLFLMTSHDIIDDLRFRGNAKSGIALTMKVLHAAVAYEQMVGGGLDYYRTEALWAAEDAADKLAPKKDRPAGEDGPAATFQPYASRQEALFWMHVIAGDALVQLGHANARAVAHYEPAVKMNFDDLRREKLFEFLGDYYAGVESPLPPKDRAVKSADYYAAAYQLRSQKPDVKEYERTSAEVLAMKLHSAWCAREGVNVELADQRFVAFARGLLTAPKP